MVHFYGKTQGEYTNHMDHMGYMITGTVDGWNPGSTRQLRER